MMSAKTLEDFNAYWISDKRKQIENHPYIKHDSVLNYADKYNYSGIYCICLNNKVVYIGQSKNMMYRIKGHIGEILEVNPSEKKYSILKEAKNAGITIEFKPLYYCKRVREDAVKKELNEKEAYFINYYLPPLNKLIPEHKKFEKQTSLLNKVNTYNDAITLAKPIVKEAIRNK